MNRVTKARAGADPTPGDPQPQSRQGFRRLTHLLQSTAVRRTHTSPADGLWTLLQTERADFVISPDGQRHTLPQALSWLAAEAPDVVAGLGLAVPDLDCHDCHDVWA